MAVDHDGRQREKRIQLSITRRACATLSAHVLRLARSPRPRAVLSGTLSAPGGVGDLELTAIATSKLFFVFFVFFAVSNSLFSLFADKDESASRGFS